MTASVIDVLRMANDRGEIGYAYGGADGDLPAVQECLRRGWIVYSHDASVGGRGDPMGRSFQRRDIYRITGDGKDRVRQASETPSCA